MNDSVANIIVRSLGSESGKCGHQAFAIVSENLGEEVVSGYVRYLFDSKKVSDLRGGRDSASRNIPIEGERAFSCEVQSQAFLALFQRLRPAERFACSSQNPTWLRCRSCHVAPLICEHTLSAAS